MAVVAKLNYLRIAPRKVRLVADLIREKSVKEAQSILNFTVKRSTTPLLKLLNQAITSAVNNFQLDSDNLYISKITVDEGPKYKRWRPRARGQAYEIQKKTSHITIVLKDRTGSSSSKKRKKAKVAVKKADVQEIKEEKLSPVSAVDRKSEEKAARTKTSKFKPEIETVKPKIERGIKKMFRRKAF